MIPAVMATYDRFDVAFERGEGAYLYSTDGRRFLDFGAGIAVTVLGHCHPHLVEALCAQAGRVWHCSNLYRIPDQERLAQRLVDASFADAAFFCNSGAEAIECGLKLVRKYQDIAGAPDRYRVITCTGAFHGRTLATIAAGGSEKHLAGFEPEVDGFDHAPFGDLEAVRAAVGPRTAAILVEPIQGEGGIHPASADFLRGLREIADAHGLLLFFDEVQCGHGPHRAPVRARVGRRHAGRDGDRQGSGRRVPGRRLPGPRARGGGVRSGQPRLHLRRQSSGDGGGQRRARHRSGRTVSRARARDRRGAAAPAGSFWRRGSPE